MLVREDDFDRCGKGGVKPPRIALDSAIIRTGLVGKERQLARLAEELTRTVVTLNAMRTLLECAPEAPQGLALELVDTISLLHAAETVVGSACGKIRNCSEALVSAQPQPLATVISFSGSDGRQDN